MIFTTEHCTSWMLKHNPSYFKWFFPWRILCYSYLPPSFCYPHCIKQFTNVWKLINIIEKPQGYNCHNKYNAHNIWGTTIHTKQIAHAYFTTPFAICHTDLSFNCRSPSKKPQPTWTQAEYTLTSHGRVMQTIFQKN